MWLPRTPHGFAMPRMRASFVSTVISFALQPRMDQCRELTNYRLLGVYPAAELWWTARRFTLLISRQNSKQSSGTLSSFNRLQALARCLPHRCCERVLRLGV